jgi:hypothetical protein
LEKKRSLSTVLVYSLIFYCVSCSGPPSIQPEADLSKQSLRELLAAEEASPKDSAIVLEIAERYLAIADKAAFNNALSRALRLKRPRSKILAQRLLVLDALRYLERGEGPKALKLARQAQKLQGPGGPSAQVIEARALFASSDKIQAKSLYASLSKVSPQFLGPQDWITYARLLEKDDASGALESLAQRERLYPYELGLGAVESSLLEKEKRLGEAVFAAFTDLAYAWSLGLCGEGDLEAGLRQAEAACAGKEGETEARLAVRALRAYRSGMPASPGKPRAKGRFLRRLRAGGLLPGLRGFAPYGESILGLS